MSIFSSSIKTKLDTLREDIAQNKVLTKVDLSNSDLYEFPEELYAVKDYVEFINFGGNHLSSLPDRIAEFTKLRVLFFANNQFTQYPVALSQLPNLYMISFKSNKLVEIHEDALSSSIQWLILTDNKLKSLPKSIGNLNKLRKLMLSGNALEELPEEMSNCQNLELIRIAVNKLKVLPSWIVRLPRLAWIAYSCNSFEDKFRSSVSTNSCEAIAWSSVQIIKKLGEGASGLVYQGVLNKNGTLIDVAVKVFKGAITSDGLADDEMKVNETVGEHSSFIQVIGRIVEHPEGKSALVFPLLSEGEFSILGNPPSFDSITRDTFPEGQLFSISKIHRILLDICAACTHLHKSGIMHGDLYAHNILINDVGKALLTDFGAASFTKSVFEDLGDLINVPKLLEKIEIRAFGNLVDDLLSRCVKSETTHQSYQTLQSLILRCTEENIDARPTFNDLLDSLQKLQFSV